MRAIDQTIFYSNVTTFLCTLLAVYFLARLSLDVFLFLCL